MSATNNIRWLSLALAAVLLACEEDADGASAESPGTVTKGDEIDDAGEAPLAVPATCDAACSIEAACLGAHVDGCRQGCAADHVYFASSAATGCVQKFEAMLNCVSELSCDDAVRWSDGFEDDYPCEFEEVVFFEDCLLDGDPAPAARVSLCAKSAECSLMGRAECEASCTSQIQYATQLTPACGEAQLAMLTCAEALPCDPLRDYYEGDPDVCTDEVAAAGAICAM